MMYLDVCVTGIVCIRLSTHAHASNVVEGSPSEFQAQRSRLRLLGPP